MFKNKKRIIIISVIILIMLVVLAIIFATTGSFKHLIKQENETEKMKGVPEFSYDVYSNEKGIAVGINVVEESGIKEIKYPNSDFTLYCNGKQRVSVDYKIEKETDYIFEVTNENNETKQHTLRVDNLDDYIKIDVLTDKEIDVKGKVNITYGVAGRTNQYIIGKNNNTWTNYSKEIDIDSYTIMNKNMANEDKTVTIKARTVDNAGNIVQIEKTISCFDLDLPTVPKITITSGNTYPIITEDGIQVLTTIVDIEYDTRNDITNYYSVDGGYTWQVFTDSVKSSNVISRGTIKAKSVKNPSGLEIQTSKIITSLAPDALVDGKFDTVSVEAKYNYNVSAYKDVYIDSSANDGNTKIIIDYTLGGITVGGGTKPGWVDVTFFKEDGTTQTFTNTKSITIPQGSIKMRIQLYAGAQYAAKHDSYFTSLEVDFGPEFEENTCYALITADRIDEEYKLIKIKEAKQAKETYYKINTGEFIKYNHGEEIRLECGQTIYAKSINRDNEESVIKSHVANYSPNILVNKKFDTVSVKEQYHYNVSAYKEIYIDSSASDGNTKISMEYTLGGGSKPGWIDVTFFKEDGTTQKFTNTKSITIPQGSIKMRIQLYAGAQYAGKYDSYLNNITIVK